MITGIICQFIRDTSRFTSRDMGYWYPYIHVQASPLLTKVILEVNVQSSYIFTVNAVGNTKLVQF